MRTPLVEKQAADQARAHGIAASEVLLADNPVKRMAEPDEIAGWPSICAPRRRPVPLGREVMATNPSTGAQRDNVRVRVARATGAARARYFEWRVAR